MSGFPEVPNFRDRESFKGEQHHSSRHTSKRRVGEGHRHGRRRPDARSIPHRLVPERAKLLYQEIRERDKDLYDRQEAAGFWFDFGVDGTGIHAIYARRGSGYYMDVGASELIADGRIKLKSRVAVERIAPTSVRLSDGSALPADLIVYATGYGSMNEWAAHLISRQVADKFGKCWGLGSDTPKESRPLGRRAQEHVAAHTAGAALVSWRQPAAVAVFLPQPCRSRRGRRGSPRPSRGLSRFIIDADLLNASHRSRLPSPIAWGRRQCHARPQPTREGGDTP